MPDSATDGGPIAVVLGEIDLVRALHIGGVRCAVAASPGDPARYSRAVSHVLERVHPARDPEGMLARLLEFARAQPEPPVLFFDGDWDLLLVSRERERLAGAFRFAIADPALVESLVDKSRFRELALTHDLPVPPSQLLPAGGSAPSDLDLRFPLVVKPLTRRRATWQTLASTKAVPVDSVPDLERVVAQLGGDGVDAIAQEAVPGGEDRIESYHVYVDAAGAIVGEFTGRKLRTLPRQYGYSTALVITDQGDVRDLGRSVIEKIGLRGVAKLDFKRAPDGRLWLLEVNPRFSLWHHPGAVAGVNLPLMVYADLAGRPRPRSQRARPGVRWCVVRDDFRAARAHGIGLRRWLGFLARCEAVSGFARQDPWPLARAAIARLTALASPR
jgi:D-aspartate ligase